MADTAEYDHLLIEMGQKARSASLTLARLDTAQRNHFLTLLEKNLVDATRAILTANQVDLSHADDLGLSAAMKERLALSPEKIQKIALGVRQVRALPDPVGEVMESVYRPVGLHIRKVRVPMGVIGIIYESRPNVTIDCAILCIKSGNACILRGGKEAFATNTALMTILSNTLEESGLPLGSIQLVPTTDRAAMLPFIRLNKYLHCLIPRGGASLIHFVSENATVPVIKHFDGICHGYLHEDADEAMAVRLVVNAKCQRPGVCNALETLLIHRNAADTLLPAVASALRSKGTEIVADYACLKILHNAGIPAAPATDDDWRTEYLDLKISIAQVDSLEDAIAFINQYGSGHSEMIVTNDSTAARTFQNGVDSSSVYWNVSTRFTDGFQFGLGAEIGISTDRLHARGPMGLRELCSYKYCIDGDPGGTAL